MKSPVLIVAVFSVVAVTCALTLLPHRDKGARPSSGTSALDTATEPAGPAAGGGESVPALPAASPGPAADPEIIAPLSTAMLLSGGAGAAPAPAIHTTPLAGGGRVPGLLPEHLLAHTVSKDAPGDITAKNAAALPRPVEAVVVQEEDENGVITFHADPSSISDETDRALRLKGIVENLAGTASSDLLKLFQSESAPASKVDILSAASQIEHDQNTRLLLQAALSPEQPPDVRSSAVAHAAEQNPDLLLGQLSTSDPDLQAQLEGIFDDPEPPGESRVIGKHPRPQPERPATPAPAANPQTGSR